MAGVGGGEAGAKDIAQGVGGLEPGEVAEAGELYPVDVGEGVDEAVGRPSWPGVERTGDDEHGQMQALAALDEFSFVTGLQLGVGCVSTSAVASARA